MAHTVRMYKPLTPFVTPPGFRTYCFLVVDGGDTGEVNREVFFSIPEVDDLSNEKITETLIAIGGEIVRHYVEEIGLEDPSVSVDLVS